MRYMEHEAETQASKIGSAERGGAVGVGMGEVGRGNGRLRDWQHSSRIIRVSRASGGKDRHSKVWTAKGPRDRRVRLSVSTAIQFYDLQDRLGVDQPSKAVEWLIKAASDSISELPSLNTSFPDTPPGFDDSSAEQLSSTSEASKGSRTTKDKEEEPASSFTQLLTSGIGNMSSSSSSPMNYLGVSGQIIQLGMHQPMMGASLRGDQSPDELQHFPFIADHRLIEPPQSAGVGGNLKFSISPNSSSIAAGFNSNRGTLQSNSLPSVLPHFQRFPSSQMDGSTLPFFLGTALQNQHQNPHLNAGQFPSGLQLCYGDNGGELSGHKGKGNTNT